MSDWYGFYGEHERTTGTCPLGIMAMGEANTDEDHDILHLCDLEDQHEGGCKCSCGEAL